MNRYLLNISYLGTQFKGAQKRFCKLAPEKRDLESIQGLLEVALNCLRPINKPLITLSSRTDTGVHALHSTAHVDLESITGEPYNAATITYNLNKYLHRGNYDLRVISTQLVNKRFHARFDAVRRTYLYRIGIAKQSTHPHSAFIPIDEKNRCYFILSPDFSIEKVEDAAKLLIGKHDFRTFMGTVDLPSHKNTRRHIEQFNIFPDTNCTYLKQIQGDLETSQYEYWNFECTARSFLYRQVRRTVGVLIGVGLGKISLNDVNLMLQIPSKHSWNPKAVTAPPHALYLAKVEYKPESLHCNPISLPQPPVLLEQP